VAVLVMDMARRALVSGTGLGRITRRAVASLAGDARCGHWTGAAALTSPPGAASRVRFAFCSSVDLPSPRGPWIGSDSSNQIRSIDASASWKSAVVPVARHGLRL
jgi:hypothetical protein